MRPVGRYHAPVPDALTLYVDAYWLSPWTCTAWVGLREKGVDFGTSVAMFQPRVGALEAMRERTLTGTAPVLQHGSLWIAESLAIVEYLEEAFPPPAWPRILPVELGDRARARQVLSWLRTSQEPLRRERPTEHIFYPPPTPLAPLSIAAQQAADDLCYAAAGLGASASGCLFGDFGVVDADLAFALMRLVATGAKIPPSIAAYARAVWARPSVVEFVRHPRPPHPPPPTAD